MGRTLLGIITLTTLASSGTAQDDGVWWWFSTCGGPTMTIEVKLQGTTIEKVTTPLCRAPRDGPSSEGGRGRIDFRFRAPRSIVWEGYREEKDRTPTGEIIEGSLWQAGAEPEVVLIGVDFSTSDRILMNTIHIAHPGKRDESSIATGLTVVTYPTPATRGGGRGRRH